MTAGMRLSISVVLPVYNRESTVVQAIESVLGQSYRDFELIIVDDGSTDGSAAAIQPYLVDPRVRYHLQPNSGRPSLARNSGIALARAEWLAFIDSDDLWLPTKLERQMALVQEAASAEHPVDMVIGDYEVETNGQLTSPSFFADFRIWSLLEPATELLLPSGSLFSRQGVVGALYRRGFAATQAVLARRQVVEDCGCFDPELVFAEDNDLWLKVAERGVVGCVNGPVHRYIIHGSNITSAKKSSYFTDTIRVLAAHEGSARKLGLSVAPLRERAANYRLGLSEFHFRRREWAAGWRAVGASLPGLYTRRNLKALARSLAAAAKSCCR